MHREIHEKFIKLAHYVATSNVYPSFRKPYHKGNNETAFYLTLLVETLLIQPQVFVT